MGLNPFAVADDFSFGEIYNIFGDIGGMVGDALQVAGNMQIVD